MKQDIWFVIVTYKPDTAILERLQKSLGGRPVITIDNSKKNLGFGGGANVGIRKALESGAQWLVILNQDIDLTKRDVDKLYTKLLLLPPCIAGPLVGGLDERRWTTVLPSKKVDYISGSCMAIHRSVFDKTGMFYKPYFMYYEDVDFCVRAKNAGFPLIHVSIAGISHNETTSLGRGSFLHQYYLARNHLLFVERNAPMGVKIHELFRLPKTIWEHYKKQERGALVGIRDYFLRRFGQYTPL